MTRAFIALEIPGSARERIGATIETLRPKFAGVRWQSPLTIHLTLRFLGDTRPDQIERLRPMLARAVSACPARDVRIAGLGMFPERGRPSVLWLGVKITEELMALQRACEQAAAACGYAPEAKPFLGHVTLGRWNTRVSRPTLPAHDLGTVRLDTLVLFQSELAPKGAVHTPLATYPLRALDVR